MSKQQFLLIDSRPAWRLDRSTREQGLQGVRKARAIIRAIAQDHEPETATKTQKPISEAA